MFSYGNKVYISYSAATVDKFYTLGLMMADKGKRSYESGQLDTCYLPAVKFLRHR